jgi:hypothetical protein
MGGRRNQFGMFTSQDGISATIVFCAGPYSPLVVLLFCCLPGVAMTAMLSSIAPGRFSLPANSSSDTSFHFGKFTVIVVLTEDGNDGPRYAWTTVNVVCPLLFYGVTCGEKQNISISVMIGKIALVACAVITLTILWGEWLNHVPFASATQRVMDRLRCGCRLP